MTISTSVNEPPVKFLVQEKKTTYTKHDQLFKELINNFLNEFIAKVTHLNKEEIEKLKELN